ncbi:MAG: hypothetical protein DMD62_12960 [Gemmatimonadetes bacterium]|nr:MAG: hypothetical protein DMD62_12960 [Gemmatimonadota bacterium]
MGTPDQLPNPDLDGQPIDGEQFGAFTPEKFELVKGYLFDSREHPESRRNLLKLLLVNLGLVEVVRSAPEERWREALRHAYKPGGT